MKLSVVVPCYNEEDNIGKLKTEFFPVLEKLIGSHLPDGAQIDSIEVVLGNDCLGEKIEVPLLTKEIGFVGGKEIHHVLQLFVLRWVGDQLVILAKAAQAQGPQTLGEAAGEQYLFALCHTNAGNLVDKCLKQGVLLIGQRDGARCRWDNRFEVHFWIVCPFIVITRC